MLVIILLRLDLLLVVLLHVLLVNLVMLVVHRVQIASQVDVFYSVLVISLCLVECMSVFFAIQMEQSTIFLIGRCISGSRSTEHLCSVFGDLVRAWACPLCFVINLEGLC